ncbi:MAG: formylglycine-generating enzyme family protein, partial [bacterium]|nr:formylglycine-generating enzyme family protein [bacterium]
RFTMIIGVAVLVCVSGVQANVDMETVPVGNLGNTGEWSGESYGGYGPDRICGAVDYAYNIGKYEVTAGQYTEFLNAVAATDTYGLYSSSMWSSSSRGCKIQQSGSSPNYTYSVAADWADRPVNYVSWGDSARFSNWMHNGQGSGDTEDGSYFLNGATSLAALLLITREPDATWVIPSEDEWYKSAYHKNDGVTGNYWDYPTSSDSVPSNDLDGGGNNATFYDMYHYPLPAGYTIGSPYYRTEFGAHLNSDSPYGTFDQGGNLWEWNEAVLGGSHLARGTRGGACDGKDAWLASSYRGIGGSPDNEYDVVGFRLAQVPEPCSLVLLSLGGLMVMKRRR